MLLLVYLAAIIHNENVVFNFLNEHDRENQIFKTMLELFAQKIGSLHERKLICLGFSHILSLQIIPEYLQ